MESQYTNKDLIDFKDSLIGSSYGSVDPTLKLFGIGRSTFYDMRDKPDKPLQNYYAATLRVYKSLTHDVLTEVIKKAHGIDLREIR